MTMRRIGTWMLFIIATTPLLSEAQLQQQQQQQPRQPTPRPPARQTTPPDVVVTVNGAPITKREIDNTVQRQVQQLQAQRPQEIGPEVAQQLEPQAIDSLIESRLVEQYAIDEGPAVEEQEVQASMDHLKRQLSEQGSSFDQFLTSQGHTADSFKSRIKGSIAWHKVQQQEVTDEKLNQFFQQNQDRFGANELDEVRPQVTNAYIEDLWKRIVAQMKPDAEIRTAGRQPQQQIPGNPPQPRQQVPGNPSPR